MNIIREYFKNNMKKFLVTLSVIFLCGSILGMSGIAWGAQEPDMDPTVEQQNSSDNSRVGESSGTARGARSPFIYDLDSATSYPHEDLTMYGAGSYDGAGNSVATGDVDGDGIEDIIIGAFLADGPSNRIDSGAVYIIYGSTSLPSTKDLANADVKIYGDEANDYAGSSVATGDVNGDNKDDIIIGAYNAAGPLNGRMFSGEVYVVFGSGSLATTIDLNTTNPGLKIYGQEHRDSIGFSVASGDVSGDVNDDIVIGAVGAYGTNSARPGSGEVYIINGKSFTPGTTIDLNTTTPGTKADVTIYGTDGSLMTLGDQAGHSIAIGDIDGSGKEDLIIGAPLANGQGNTKPMACGEVYIIYGSTSLPGTIYSNTSDPGPNYVDVIIYGKEGNIMSIGDQAGFAVGAGDVCGDTKDDIIIGAPNADGPANNRQSCGEVYIIKGSNSLPNPIDLAVSPLLDVLIFGADTGDLTGSAVDAGDITNDTQQDILIGARDADSGPSDNRLAAGKIYIINGTTTLPATIDTNITTINPHHNGTVWGADADDSAGAAISAGDVNDDTIVDLIIGAYLADGPNNNRPDSGDIYVIFGTEGTGPVSKPWITITNPSDGMTGVAVDASIIVNFSQPMKQNYPNDFDISCTPDPNPGGWSFNWNSNGDGVEISNSNNFYENTLYQFEITVAKDLLGKPLIANPDPKIPNPWLFTTGDFTNPMITLTSPANNTVNVKIDEGINITFNESMNISTVQFTCEPDPGGWQTPTWNATNETVIFNHTNPFQESMGYWFNITAGNDISGLQLVQNPDPMVPNSFRFWTGDFSPPNIETTVPANNTQSVLLDASITVIFSEPMNDTKVQFDCDPDPGGWQLPQWNTNKDQVTYAHTNDFDYETWYNFTITAGEDLTGNELIPDIKPNPWRFKTVGYQPQIIFTDPSNGSINVPLNKDIVITFSKPMERDKLLYDCNPVLSGGFTPQWNTENTEVTLKHDTDFQKTTNYTFEITAGVSLDGYNLNFDINNPFSFMTVGDNPIILKTTPVDGLKNVGLQANIIVEFSESMDIGEVVYSCNPEVVGGFTPQWNAQGNEVTYTHMSDFMKNTEYEFEITAAKDLDGVNFVGGNIPNPWTFRTVGDEPLILETDPANDAINVYLGAPIKVKFSEPMNIDSVKFTCTVDPGEWENPVWNANKDEVTFKHNNPFIKNSMYIFEITEGKDLEDFDLIPGEIPNPWTFTSAGDDPMIIETIPEDGAAQVLLDADIIVKFSKSMNTETVEYECDPTISGGFTHEWNLDKTEVKYKHTTELTKDTLYKFKVTAAQDQEGFDLILGSTPNPWTFRSIGDNPIITSTYPADDSSGVPLDADIVVEFNKPMDPNSVDFWSDKLPAGGLTPYWDETGEKVTYTHTTNFIKNIVYSVRITTGKDLNGNDLVQGALPNPWSFRTVGDEPVIFSTEPADGEVDVGLNMKIVIEFSEPMNTASIKYSCKSDLGDPGGWTKTWSNGDEILTLDHSPFKINTKYKFEITEGEDLVGDKLITGSVPNPWEFSTGTKIEMTVNFLSPSNNETVDSLKPTLSWEGSANAIEYFVYLGTDKAQVQNLNTSLRIRVTDTSYTPTSDLSAETTYYWTVIPSDGTNTGSSDSGVWSFVTPKKDEESSDFMWWIIIAIIVVVIVVIILVVIFMRKKKELPPPEEEEEHEIPPPEAEAPAGPEVRTEPGGYVAPTPAPEPITAPAPTPVPAPSPAPAPVPAPTPEAPPTEAPPAPTAQAPAPQAPAAQAPAAAASEAAQVTCPICSAMVPPGATACIVCGTSV